MRALGIDFGEKRIGLAISDAEGRFALPLTTIERQTDRRAAYRIADLAREEAVELLVLGEPLDLHGVAGVAAERVRRFGDRLSRASGLPIRWVDEALTTVEAAERLHRADLDRRERPERRDAVAAQILLQEALDRESGEAGGERAVRRLFRFLLVLTLLAVVAGAGAGAWAWKFLHEPYQDYQDRITIDIEPGTGATRILERLESEGVLPDARLARAFLIYRLRDPSLKAGEYLFDRPMNTPQVLERLTRGEVVTYPVTLIEGLDIEEVADALAEKGFGDRDVLRAEMNRTELISDWDPEATNLEGYLYPDTYSFARGTTEEEIVATLVRTFRKRFSAEVEPLLSGDRGLTVREVVTLASIVEKETGVGERPRIAGVYSNRLRINMGLYADPTVIYALKLLGRWDGNIRREDLRVDSPYNTYVYSGLPPGPICSPPVASLVAAANPEEHSYFYFVSRNDGSHVFAETHAEHSRNVDRWQKQYWRQRWARERQGK